MHCYMYLKSVFSLYICIYRFFSFKKYKTDCAFYKAIYLYYVYQC